MDNSNNQKHKITDDGCFAREIARGDDGRVFRYDGARRHVVADLYRVKQRLRA
jgi:hypothetical protein